jgi:hypothetical protein
MNNRLLEIQTELERANLEMWVFEDDRSKIKPPFNPEAKKKEIASIAKRKGEEEARAKNLMRAAESAASDSKKKILQLTDLLFDEIRKARMAADAWRDSVPLRRLPDINENTRMIRMRVEKTNTRFLGVFDREGSPSVSLESVVEVQRVPIFRVSLMQEKGWVVDPDQDLTPQLLDETNSFTVQSAPTPSVFDEIEDRIGMTGVLIQEIRATQKEVESFEKSVK